MRLLSLSAASIQPRTGLRKSVKAQKVSLQNTAAGLEDSEVVVARDERDQSADRQCTPVLHRDVGKLQPHENAARKHAGDTHRDRVVDQAPLRVRNCIDRNRFSSLQVDEHRLFNSLGGQEDSLRRLVGGAHKRDEPEKDKSRSCCGAAVHRSCSRRASTRANMTPNMQCLLRKCIFDFAKCCQCLPKLANVGERPCTLEVRSSAVFLKLALCL